MLQLYVFTTEGLLTLSLRVEMVTGFAEQLLLNIISGFFFDSARHAIAISLPSLKHRVSPAVRENRTSRIGDGKSLRFFIAVPVKVVPLFNSMSVEYLCNTYSVYEEFDMLI